MDWVTWMGTLVIAVSFGGILFFDLCYCVPLEARIVVPRAAADADTHAISSS